MKSTRARLWLLGTVVGLGLQLRAADVPPSPEAVLATEVASRGWLLFSARSDAGDYDLFLCRPDGSHRRALTSTPDWDEYGGRFSPDSRRILYRRRARALEVVSGEGINHDTWGATGSLVVANADGTDVKVLGKDGQFPWASWGSDDRQLACLYRREGKIRIVDAASLSVVRELPRHGIFQQLFWSTDGRRICGTANFNGQDWNVVSLDLESGRVTLLSRALNCTPDWFRTDTNRVVYSNRTPGLETDYGWTMLMEATADGKERTLLYAERGRHIYYGSMSPDDRYVVFSVPATDGGTDAPLAIIRRADAPIVVPEDYRSLKALYPQARSGPVLRLKQPGFEPYWTYADLPIR
jgi:Tol biopolymer transport system component